MKIGTDAILIVKWANGVWSEYRVAPFRQRETLMRYFCQIPHFRFAILYKYDKERKERLEQIGYFDKHKNIF